MGPMAAMLLKKTRVGQRKYLKPAMACYVSCFRQTGRFDAPV
jgi:hypothetical protein